jgi:hypothetical protein
LAVSQRFTTDEQLSDSDRDAILQIARDTLASFQKTA